MKKCSYCGAEYPDSATECDLDRTPLQDVPAPTVIYKGTTIVAVAVGGLLLALSGRYLPLLAPATIGWFVTVFADRSKHRRMKILGGLIAAFCFFVESQILTVGLIVGEQAGNPTIRNPSAIAAIVMFVVYLVLLISYFGRILRAQSNQSAAGNSRRAGQLNGL